MDYKKGQYFSFDAIIATLMFILIVISLLSYWSAARSTMEFQNGDLLKEAQRVSDYMFSPPPASIPEGQCAFGFSDSWNSRLLHFSDISNCMGVSQETLRGAAQSPYNVTILFNLTRVIGDTKEFYIGSDPADIPSNAEIAKVRRIAAIEHDFGDTSTLATVDVYLYR